MGSRKSLVFEGTVVGTSGRGDVVNTYHLVNVVRLGILGAWTTSVVREHKGVTSQPQLDATSRLRTSRKCSPTSSAFSRVIVRPSVHACCAASAGWAASKTSTTRSRSGTSRRLQGTSFVAAPRRGVWRTLRYSLDRPTSEDLLTARSCPMRARRASVNERVVPRPPISGVRSVGLPSARTAS